MLVFCHKNGLKICCVWLRQHEIKADEKGKQGKQRKLVLMISISCLAVDYGEIKSSAQR